MTTFAEIYIAPLNIPSIRYAIESNPINNTEELEAILRLDNTKSFMIIKAHDSAPNRPMPIITSSIELCA